MLHKTVKQTPHSNFLVMIIFEHRVVRSNDEYIYNKKEYYHYEDYNGYNNDYNDYYECCLMILVYLQFLGIEQHQ